MLPYLIAGAIGFGIGKLFENGGEADSYKFFDVYDKKTDKTLKIKAESLADAKIYAEESIDFNEYKDGEKINLFDWFWNYDYRHYLRDASPKQRNIVKQKFIKKGLELNGSSPKHAYIVVSTINPSELTSFKKVGSDGIKFAEGGEAGEKYVNGGGVGKYKMYKLRAEGLNDFLNFLGTGVYFNVKSFTVEPIGVPDVVVSFETNLSLSEIKAKLREVQDSHVMLETIKPIKEYTGERYAGGGSIDNDLQKLQDTHEKIREILIENGSEEYGDVIIDQISEAVGISTTLSYYDEDEEYVKPTKVILKGNLSEKELQKLKDTHEKIREILIENGSEEYGDVIIDQISEVVGIPTTLDYYDEDDYAEGGLVVNNNTDLQEVAKYMTNAVKKHRWDLKDLIHYFEKDNNFDYKKRVKIWEDMNGYEMKKTYDNIYEMLKRISEANGSKFAEGGVAKKRRRSASVQYGRSNTAVDKTRPAKPVGYRFTDEKATELNKETYDIPTESEVKKYLGKGIYKENRKRHSDKDRNVKL